MSTESGPRRRDDNATDRQGKSPLSRRNLLILFLAAAVAVAGLVTLVVLRSGGGPPPQSAASSNKTSQESPVGSGGPEVVAPPETPAGLTVQALSDSLVGLSWHPDANTSSVRVQRRDDQGAFREIASVSGDFSYRDDGLAPGTVYGYRITVERLDGGMVHSREVSVMTLPASPSLSPTSSPSPSEVDLAWGQLDPSVSMVRIERRNGGDDFTTIAEVPSPGRSYRDTGLEPNAIYTYRVRAANAAGMSAYSEETEAITLPDSPSDLAARALGETEVELSWFNPDGLPVPIQIERQRGPGGPVSLMKTDPGQPGFVDRSLTPNTVYLYRVRAVNRAGSSDYSAPARTLTPPEAPDRLKVQPESPTTLGLTWQVPPSPPAQVVVERSDGASPFVEIARLEPGSARYADEGLQPNSAYTYRVFTANEEGSSSASQLVEASTLPTAPSGVETSPLSPGEIEIHWSYPEDVDGFHLEREDDNRTLRRVLKGGGTSFVDRSLRANTLYRYRVQAFNRSGGSAYSEWAEVWTPPLAPSLLQAVAVSPYQIQLTWRYGDGRPAAIRVERRQRGLGFEEIDWVDPGFDQYVDGSVLEDRVYEYRVVAANDSGFSEFSNPIAVATPPLPFPSGVRLKRDRVVAGEAVEAVVTLSAPAPPAGWTLKLTSSDTRLVDIPPYLDILPGESWKGFTIATSERIRNVATVRVSAESGGRLASVDLTIEPRFPPDPAADRIEFRVLRTGGNGKILVRGVVRNVGRGGYRSGRGQQSAQMYEVFGGSAKLIGQASFQNLEPGEEFGIDVERPFDFGSELEGGDEAPGPPGRGRRDSATPAAPSVSHPPDSPQRRVPAQYRFVIEYASDIGDDGNPGNDDRDLGNNRISRSGADIVRLWRTVPRGEPF